MKRRVTAFLAGRICALFDCGSGFDGLDRRFRLPRGTAAKVYRRWVLRSRRAR